MSYESYSNEVVDKAFGNSLEKDQLLNSLRDYISQYEQSQDISYRMGMAYQFAGIMGSNLFRTKLSQDEQITEVLALCGRLEIDKLPESADWQQLKTLVGF